MESMNEAQTFPEERSVHGLWWVAEAPRSKVAGILRYGSAQGIRLELNKDPLRALRGRGKLVEQERRWRHKPNVILGQSDDQRERFTVIDALPLSIGTHLRFFANHVLNGRHFTEPKSATFKQIFFELDYLEAWAGGPLLGDAMTRDDHGHLQVRTLFAFDTGKGHYEISAHANPFFRERESGTAYTCSVLVTMTSPITLGQVFGELEKFLSLMTILVGVRVRPRRLGVCQRPKFTPIEIIASWSKKIDRSLTHWDMLVPLCNLGDGASLVFAKWFDQWHSTRESIAMFLTACSTTFTAVKFLCLVNGIESFGSSPKSVMGVEPL